MLEGVADRLQEEASLRLWMAACADPEGVAAALAQGADPDARFGTFGLTALMAAVKSGREQCVGLILPVCDVDARDDEGLTALGIAAAYGLAGMLEILLRAGADPDVRDRQGALPIVYALQCAGEGWASGDWRSAPIVRAGGQWARCVEALSWASDLDAPTVGELTVVEWLRSADGLFKKAADRLEVVAAVRRDAKAVEAASMRPASAGRSARAL